MAQSALRARPATVKELAWILRHDLRRTVRDALLPTGSTASTGELARLVAGCYAVPHPDHIAIATDNGVAYLRLLTCAQTGFPSTDMELPGGEWLKDLILGGEFDTGPIEPVEVSVRGRNLSQVEAAKILREAIALTKEQEAEARRGVAVEPPEDVLEARAALATRLKQVRQGTVGMVLDCPVWIVEAATLEQLDRRTSQVIDSYGGRGITLWVPEHLQDVLYKETILGDRQRFTDCEQFRPMSTLVGSWFHGGSVLGHATGPYLGGVIGSTPSAFRYRFSDAQMEKDAVTTAFLGRTRGGKSTGLMLSTLAELAFGGDEVVAALTDQKGDLGGIVDACGLLGIPVTTISTATQASGTADPFRYVESPAEAASMAVDFLLQTFGPTTRPAAESIVRAAGNVIAAHPDPDKRSTHHIIELLRNSKNKANAAVGADLHETAKDPNARAVMGAWTPGTQTLSAATRGLVYFRLEGLRLPEEDSAETSWKPGERVSMMALQASYAFITYMVGRIKGVPKTVGLTELHLITGYAFGRALIGRLARTAAALDCNVFLDTQACAELVAIKGLIDQISTVFAFRVDSDDEAIAQARLLKLEPEDAVLQRQQSWRPGQCEVRDRWGQVAPFQFDLMTTALRDALDTTPDRDDLPEAA
jgi:hypothetical protein